jgi:hypothetical protein
MLTGPSDPGQGSIEDRGTAPKGLSFSGAFLSSWDKIKQFMRISFAHGLNSSSLAHTDNQATDEVPIKVRCYLLCTAHHLHSAGTIRDQIS